MSRLGSLDHLMFHAADVQALVAFYSDVLDGTAIEESYPEWARLRLANIDLALRQGEVTPNGGQPAFRVADIAALRAHLEVNGVPCEEYEELPGAVRMSFRDPAGNVLQALQWGANLDGLR